MRNLFCDKKLGVEQSRPSRARGLKLVDGGPEVPEGVSRPSRARGLKLAFYHLDVDDIEVAPLTGAWIETP